MDWKFWRDAEIDRKEPAYQYDNFDVKCFFVGSALILFSLFLYVGYA